MANYKIVNADNIDAMCQAIAVAICKKRKEQEKLSFEGFLGAIEDIPDIDHIIDRSVKELKSHVERVGNYAFNGCNQLEVADFTEVGEISVASFRVCSALKALILRKNSMCVLSTTSAFTSSAIALGRGYVYVPSALIDEYKAATNWSMHAAQFRALEEYTVDGTLTGALDTTKTGG